MDRRRPCAARGFILFAVLLLADSSQAARMEISHCHQADIARPSTLTVAVDSLDSEISGFSVLLAVDLSSYMVRGVRPGAVFDDCQWEYFTYRFIYDSTGQYELYGYTNLLLVTGFASVTAGFAPTCYGSGSSFDLMEMDCVPGYPTPGRPIECEFFPVRFYWRDCGDNVLYSRNNDTVHTAFEVTDYGGAEPVVYAFPGFGVPDPPCGDPPGQTAMSSLSLRNGGLDVVCPPATAIRGDVNLNGVHYEMGDLLLLTRYFVYGLVVFNINLEGQIYQSDIDCDGMLGIGDIIMMVRVIVGDIPPISCPLKKLADAWHTARLVKDGSRLRLETSTEVGAVYLRFVGPPGRAPSPADISHLGSPFRVGAIGDTTTLLLVNYDGSPALSAGRHELLRLNGDQLRLAQAQVADMEGRRFRLDLEDLSMPNEFVLQQNYPNPFNPATTISFFLPVDTDWKLLVLNVAGQTVREYSGCDRGWKDILWDGRGSGGDMVASGVYLYRLEADRHTQVRKMLLIK